MEPKKKRILIAVDGSKQSFEAVRYVGLMLPKGRAKITLFHALSLIPENFSDLESGHESLPQAVDFQTWELQQRKSIEDFMEQAGRLLVSQGYSKDAVSVIVEEREIGIARDIMREARKGYDALVLGRRGLSDLKGLLFGSIANKLVSHLQQVPVWVVGGRPDPKKILVAMDQSQGAMRALEYVGEMLQDSHPELLLFHVSRGMVVPQAGYDGPVLPQQEQYWFEKAKEHFNRAEKEMEFLFKQCIKKMKKKGVDVSRINTKIVPGVYSRAGAIFGEAQEGGYGTIVVGRRGLSRVEEFVMGRVSSKVLQLAEEMAVWVVHQVPLFDQSPSENPRSLSENASFVISNGAQQSEKSVTSTGCKNKISRLRLEMTVLGQAPRTNRLSCHAELVEMSPFDRFRVTFLPADAAKM